MLIVQNQASPISPRQIGKLVETDSPLILEIGCNDGTDTLNLLTVPGAKVHCFECDPRPIARFYAKLKQALNDGRVQLHEHAVGAIDGQATFHQSGGTTQGAHLEDWDLSGSLKTPLAHQEKHKWCKFEHDITVDVKRLDTWLHVFQPPQIDFIWLDVQGAEADVFAGGPYALKRTRYLYTEFNHHNKPLYEGDLNLAQLQATLGPHWQLIGLHEGYNALLKNLKFQAGVGNA